MSPSVSLDTILDAIAARLVVHLAPMLVVPPTSSTTVEYSSAEGGTLPPGKSRRWLREHAPAMPGARRAGRAWSISKGGFDAWCADQARARRMARKAEPVATDDDARVTEFFARSEQRATRKAANR